MSDDPRMIDVDDDIPTPKVRPLDADDDTGTEQAGHHGPAPEPPTPRARRGQDARLRDGLVRFYTSMALPIAGIGVSTANPALAAAGVNIANQAEGTADAWMELADSNPRVKAALLRFAEGTGVASILFAHVTMVAPLLSAGGFIPAHIGGMFLDEEARQNEMVAMAVQHQQQRQGAAAQANGTTTSQ